MFAPRQVFALSALLLLSACSSSSMDQDRAVGATAAQQQAIASLRQTYAEGRFGDVIRQSARSAELRSAPTAIRVEALKLEAFSYCVTNHRALCEQQFTRILALDPQFELAGAERGHPQWQPAFDAARKAR